jgi:hypothetical protein
MERTDWPEQGYDPAEARFLTPTAITRHRFGSPARGRDEARGLHLELTRTDRPAARAAAGHAAGRGGRPREGAPCG